jgi:hypothetical protein
MKEASGWLRANEGPDEQALGAGNTSEQTGQLQTLKVPGKPRFPPRSDCADSIDPHPVILLKERHP